MGCKKSEVRILSSRPDTKSRLYGGFFVSKFWDKGSKLRVKEVRLQAKAERKRGGVSTADEHSERSVSVVILFNSTNLNKLSKIATFPFCFNILDWSVLYVFKIAYPTQLHRLFVGIMQKMVVIEFSKNFTKYLKCDNVTLGNINKSTEFQNGKRFICK